MLDVVARHAGPALATDAAPVLPLTARGLVFEAGGRRPIDGIDLELDAGAPTAVMGPNGAGKSLLLRLLHGLLEPTAGDVLFAGRPAGRAVRMRQAMVFQRPVLLRRSVADNVAYVLASHGVLGRDSRVRMREWLERAGLVHLAGRPARILSGGEQQRLAVARALSCAPEILFLDEPTASLDPASVLAIEELIQAARGAGTKIVLVTHDLGQARRLAEEIVFLYRGRIEERAPAAAFLARPRSEKARAFVEGRIVL